MINIKQEVDEYTHLIKEMNRETDDYIRLRKEMAKNIIKEAIKLYLNNRVDDEYFKGITTGICLICDMRLERYKALEHLLERVKKSKNGGN